MDGNNNGEGRERCPLQTGKLQVVALLLVFTLAVTRCLLLCHCVNYSIELFLLLWVWIKQCLSINSLVLGTFAASSIATCIMSFSNLKKVIR